MKKIIVFDFDKTLTYEDTMLEYFFYCGKQKGFFYFRAFEYAFFLVLRKFKLISNLKLKEHGIRIFISKRNKQQVTEISVGFSKTIPLKKTVTDRLKAYDPTQFRVMIVTASFVDYVKPLYPDLEVVGSEFSYKGDKLGLKFHCYKKEKVVAMKKEGIDQIDVLYTDSGSDLPLAEISKQTELVVDEKFISCQTVDEFKSALEQNKATGGTIKKAHQFLRNLFSHN